MIFSDLASEGHEKKFSEAVTNKKKRRNVDKKNS